MESSSKDGDRPVVKSDQPCRSSPSKASHVEPGLNLGGPPPKAKYYLATDSEEVARAKDEKNPERGVQRI